MSFQNAQSACCCLIRNQLTGSTAHERCPLFIVCITTSSDCFEYIFFSVFFFCLSSRFCHSLVARPVLTADIITEHLRGKFCSSISLAFCATEVLLVLLQLLDVAHWALAVAFGRLK